MYPLLATDKVRPDGVEPGEAGYRYTATLVN
jgi:hypothetical protein